MIKNKEENSKKEIRFRQFWSKNFQGHTKKEGIINCKKSEGFAYKNLKKT